MKLRIRLGNMRCHRNSIGSRIFARFAERNDGQLGRQTVASRVTALNSFADFLDASLVLYQV